MIMNTMYTDYDSLLVGLLKEMTDNGDHLWAGMQLGFS